jgi:hypothetical protein
MRSPTRACLWALPVVLCLGAAAPAAPDDGEPVVVSLRSVAPVTAAPVCVRNVASLAGGPAALRERIAGLDVADLPRPGAALPIRAELIAYRIQMAGIPRGRFRVEGAPQVVVRPLGGAPGSDNPVLVRQRDLVKAVARVGGLCVTAKAEAEQDGRAGDLIRVRNIDSKKEIVGRVVDRGLVEVEY